jgi:hypothetical protein
VKWQTGRQSSAPGCARAIPFGGPFRQESDAHSSLLDGFSGPAGDVRVNAGNPEGKVREMQERLVRCPFGSMISAAPMSGLFQQGNTKPCLAEAGHTGHHGVGGEISRVIVQRLGRPFQSSCRKCVPDRILYQPCGFSCVDMTLDSARYFSRKITGHLNKQWTGTFVPVRIW